MATGSSLSPKAESVDGDTIEVKRDSSEDGDRNDEFSSTRAGLIKDEPLGSATDSPSLLPQKVKTSRSSSPSTVKSRATSASSVDKKEIVERPNETPVKIEHLDPGKPSRSASQKTLLRSAPLFDHLEDATMEATRSFAVLEACTYANKFLGYTEHAMECDCNEEWDSTSKRNTACGEDSDCINRATKMECVGDCGCGSACQNQRFQQRQYADVSVIKTEKKGYGLRTNSDLRPGDFIFEYVGEVINEPQFRRRMVQYDEEGIKHFYFMSLSKGEFVDATKKGNLGRFCNHSCSPNCYVDKWVVGDKLRMGIFAERKIKAGEELVFNYNVDRYGANPQPCYCGEPNCTGFIGGKTQTERATKLSAATIEALGIEDGDSWETTVAKRPRKKKAGEEDEEYVESIEAKSLDTDGVTKVMAALMQCKEKWIAVKLLQRIQRCDDEQVRNRVVKMHGYQILNSQLAAWKDDVNVILQILDILDKFPRLTRNKIADSKIESTLQPFTVSEDERVSSQASTLLEQWSKLEVAYRIPRKKRDANENATPQKQENRYERRESGHERKRSRSRSRSRTPPRGPSTSSAPSGPRSSLPQRSSNYYQPRPPPFHRPVSALPRGWFQALDNGKTYYYSADGQTTWTRPIQPAAQPPPPPPKQPSSQDVLKSIIDNIVSAKEKEREVKNTTPETPQAQTRDKKDKKEEKWKSYDEVKKKKLYENTLFPHISHVMNKYKAKIPREDLKRFAKELAKKLVESDFKGGRVEDPTKISDKHQQKVKKYCKEFFEKAAHKHSKHEKEKAAKKAKLANGTKTDSASMSTSTSIAASPKQNLDASPEVDIKNEDGSDDEDIKMSEDEREEDVEPMTASLSMDMQNGDSLKRKRSRSEGRDVKDEDDLTKSPLKKLNLDSPPPPPPPPPAPPMETPDGTPGQSEDASPAEMCLHADTSFKSKSMADVLAEAQQDTGDDADISIEDANIAFAQGLEPNGSLYEEEMLDNLTVDRQA